MKDQSNVLSQIKLGHKLIGKPKKLRIKRTVYPPNWNPDNIKSFAEAATAWRLQNVLIK